MSPTAGAKPSTTHPRNASPFGAARGAITPLACALPAATAQHRAIAAAAWGSALYVITSNYIITRILKYYVSRAILYSAPEWCNGAQPDADPSAAAPFNQHD